MTAKAAKSGYSGGAETVNAPGAKRRSTIPKDIREIVARQTFFMGLTSAQIQLLADAAMVEEFDAGEQIIRQGDPANRFYIILSGKIVTESKTADGSAIPIQTLGPGTDLGWSWFFPPYKSRFAARTVEPTKVIFFYATLVREQCEQDPAFGYALMKRVAGVMVACVDSLRQQLVERAEAVR